VKLAIFEELLEHYQPDFIHNHDDWGQKASLYTSAEMWREFIKPQYRRFYGAIKAKGIRISHHADCYCEPLVKDMLDLGINVWQGVTPQNDIPAIKRLAAGRLTLMGGIDAHVVDRVRATEQDIRAEVRRCLREYCPGGYFIPCVTSEVAFTPGVQDIIDDEIHASSVEAYY
jgi:uroporphyrinogen-III decarboxylase